jgi:hypothetical protein
MAKKTTTETKPEKKDAHTKKLTLLQDTQVDVCERIADSTRSYTDRAIKSRSVEPKIVEAGFKAMEAAIADGRRRYSEAQKGDDVGRAARVDLTRL